MKRHALAALLVACGGGSIGANDPDAAVRPGPHDEIADCHPWSSTTQPPAQCESACAVRPTDLPCSTRDAICYDQPPCAAATSPHAMPRDCAATFVVGAARNQPPGPADAVGCCALRDSRDGPIPTFFECRLSP